MPRLNAVLLLSVLTLVLVACGSKATPRLMQASTPSPNTPQAEPQPVSETSPGRVSTIQANMMGQDTLALVHDGDLWLKLLPDGGEKRLTHFGDVTDAHFSPDGQLVLFERQGEPIVIAGEVELEFRPRSWWVVAWNGGEPYQVLDAVDLPGQAWGETTTTAVPSVPNAWIWLPDGHAVFFTTEDVIHESPNDDLWRLDPETGQLETLLPTGLGGRPTLSPDGRMLLLSTNSQVAVSEIDGTGRRTLLSFGPLPAHIEIPCPQWDGGSQARVAIVQQQAWGGPVTSTLWLLHPTTGQGAEELGQLQTSQVPQVLWSPDGSRLAYRDWGLFLANADGRNPRRIAGTDNVLPLAWSPGGHWLAVDCAGILCAVEDVEGAELSCLYETPERRVFWQDEQHLAFVSTSSFGPASLIRAQLPNVILPSPLEGAPLQAYDLYLSPSRSSRLVQATDTPIPESIEEWQHYHNPTLGFAADYPANWQREAPGPTVDAQARGWSTIWFQSDLYAYGDQAFGTYTIGVEVGDSEGRTLTETVAYSLIPNEARDTISSHCCLTVGGEPAMELSFGWPMARWGNRRIVVIHEGREYHIDLAPQVAIDSDTPTDTLARAAFDTFLRTFTFVPVSATPMPLTPTITAVPTPTSKP